MSEARNIKLDGLLIATQELEQKRKELEEKISAYRDEILKIVSSETDGQYKNDVATVTSVTRKKIIYKNKAAVIATLQRAGLPKYIEKIIKPNKLFEDEIKSGALKYEGVEIEETSLPQIRYKQK